MKIHYSPINVPRINGLAGTPTTGDEIFINQLGRIGVILKNII